MHLLSDTILEKREWHSDRKPMMNRVRLSKNGGHHELGQKQLNEIWQADEWCHSTVLLPVKFIIVSAAAILNLAKHLTNGLSYHVGILHAN